MGALDELPAPKRRRVSSTAPLDPEGFVPKTLIVVVAAVGEVAPLFSCSNLNQAAAERQ